MAQLKRAEKEPAPLQRVLKTQKTTTIALPDPAPAQHHSVSNNYTITINPIHVKRKPPQNFPRVIPDDTNIMIPDTNPYDINTIHVTPVKKYNTRDR